MSLREKNIALVVVVGVMFAVASLNWAPLVNHETGKFQLKVKSTPQAGKYGPSSETMELERDPKTGEFIPHITRK